MRFRSVLIGTVFLACSYLAATPEAEASFKKMSTVEMVDAADMIVRGTVVETWTEVGEHGRIWTRAQINIIESYKGAGDARSIVVDQLGGEYGGVRMHIDSAAQFSHGEEIVIFLDELRSGKLCPISMFAGKWTVRLDPYTQTKIVQRFTVEAGAEYDHRFIPLPSPSARIYLSDFKTTINDRVKMELTEGVK